VVAYAHSHTHIVRPGGPCEIKEFLSEGGSAVCMYMRPCVCARVLALVRICWHLHRSFWEAVRAVQ
jgi:hypothetical protein